MNWTKLIGSIVAAAFVCFGAHSVAAGSVGAAAANAHTWIDTALCIAANLAGLFTDPTK